MKKDKKEKEDLIYNPPYSMPNFIFSIYRNNYDKKINKLIKDEIENNNFHNENITYKFFVSNKCEISLSLSIGKEIYFIHLAPTILKKPINRMNLQVSFPNYSIGDKILHYFCGKNNLETISSFRTRDYLKEENNKLNKLYVLHQVERNSHEIYGEFTKSYILIKSIIQVSNTLNQYNFFLEKNKKLINNKFKQSLEANKNHEEAEQQLRKERDTRISALEQEVLSKLS